jgi:cytochrome c oxidase assembly factor CtaG
MQPAAQLLTAWSPDPVVLLGMTLSAGGYVMAVRRGDLRHAGRPWPVRRTVSFLSGLALMALVLVGPTGAFDDVFFWAHMTQHLVVMMLAAPLLLLGSPVVVLLRACSPAFRRRWLIPLLRSRVVDALTRPVTTWLLFAGTLLGTHFTPFYDWAIRHEAVHRFVEHPLYLTVALLYYYPLLGTNPAPHRVSPGLKVISLITMMAPETMTGFFLYSATHVFYPTYLAADRPFGPAPLADQQLGGALMWAGGMVLDAGWIALAAREWLRAEERAARRSDAALRAETLRAQNLRAQTRGASTSADPLPLPGATPG